MKIFSGSSNKLLAEKLAQNLGLELSEIEIHVFPDGERRVKLNDIVVDEETVVVQSTATPVDQNYIELFFIIDALKRSGAKSVTAVMPYLGYQRQDHIFRDGEAVSLQVMIGILESMGVNKVIVLDLHTIKIPEFFHIPIDHLSALPQFAKVIKENGWDSDSILVSPDMGGLRRIKEMSEFLSGMSWIATVKDRNLDTGEITIEKIESSVSNWSMENLKGKRALIVDDMASSGGTLIESAKLLKKSGISEVYAFVTHPIFSKDAPKLLQDSEITKVFVTDSVYVSEEKKFPKLEVLSVAEMIAKEIKD
ncbi:MAG TPA: ribose-phosphate pyrophosphokinase [Candidatus Saccharimonadales bacterium]|nr:ribose-phosphate pyrophosphokinase [Candidatus Saccharimonadales bacterium]